MLPRSKLKQTIQDILKDADLTLMSSKKVRQELEKRFNIDLTDRKCEVDEIIMMIINDKNDKESDLSSSDSDSSSDRDAMNGNSVKSKHKVCHKSNGNSQHPLLNNARKSMTTKAAASNGIASSQCESDDSSGISEIDNDTPVNKEASVVRNRKSGSGGRQVLTDEQLALRLHAEENGMRARRRATIGGGDSGAKQSRRRNTSTSSVAKGDKKKGYGRLCTLSEPLADLLGTNSMSRHEVVKRMWEIARERNLFDPKNKQFIICDDQLQDLFKRKRLRMFGIMKALTRHMWNSNE